MGQNDATFPLGYTAGMGTSVPTTRPASGDAEGSSGLLPHDVEFFYDVLGRKVARRSHNAGGVAEEHTVYHYDGADLAFETDALDGDKITRGYFNGPGVNEVLAVDEALAAEVATVWQLPDHAGTSRSVARQDGGTWKVEHRVMTPAGEVVAELGDTGDDALDEAPTIFAGHQYDDDLKLYDAKARWLDPTNQRFLSEDPLGDAGGSTNLYVYAGGDPVNYVDPDGRAIFTVGALTVAGVASYFGLAAGFGAAETGIEYAGTRAFGSQQEVENFSFLATFGKNFGINLATGGIGGKAKAGVTTARLAANYGLRQGVEIAGDTAYDVGYHGRDFTESLAFNTAGSLLGEAAGRAIGAGARSFHRNFEVAVPRTAGAVDYDVWRVPGPNPNNLRQRVVTSPTAGEGGVYLKPQSGRTKVGSTGDFRGRYGPNAPDGIEVEIPLTRIGPAADDAAYRWSARRQARFDEEYLDRVTPSGVRYRAPNNPRSPVDPAKWEQFRQVFGYGDLPVDFGL